jgi:hypothetical protein
MLAFVMDVDFEVETIVQTYDSQWLAKLHAGEITQAALREHAAANWNVARELQVKLRVVKP